MTGTAIAAGSSGPACLHSPRPFTSHTIHPAALLLGKMTLNRAAGKREQRNFRTGGNTAASQSHIEFVVTTLFDAGRKVSYGEWKARPYSPMPPDCRNKNGSFRLHRGPEQFRLPTAGSYPLFSSIPCSPATAAPRRVGAKDVRRANQAFATLPGGTCRRLQRDRLCRLRTYCECGEKLSDEDRASE